MPSILRAVGSVLLLIVPSGSLASQATPDRPPNIHNPHFAAMLEEMGASARVVLEALEPERESIPTLASKLTLRALIGRSENRA